MGHSPAFPDSTINTYDIVSYPLKNSLALKQTPWIVSNIFTQNNNYTIIK